jgi:hypothetical protein
MDLSVIIPARNEMWLQRTIEDVLAHARAETEVIAILDGDWPESPLPDLPRLRVTHSKTVIGQRAATNLGARISSATYVMKLDAHCSLDDGFDVKLIEADKELGRPDLTQIPAMYNLHAFNWRCQGCGNETYQGPTPTMCAMCAAKGTQGGPFERVVYWDLKAGSAKGHEMRTEFWLFDHDLHFQYWKDYKRRPEAKGELVDVMSSIGACFFMRRDRFFEIGGLDEAHGSWGSYGTEIACKSWLSGGRQITNRRTWFAHLFRTQGAGFGFPYPQPGSAVERARKYSQDLWFNNRWSGQRFPLAWLVEKFAPVPGWHDELGVNAGASLRRVRDAANAFRVVVPPPLPVTDHAASVTVPAGRRQDVPSVTASAAGTKSGQAVAAKDVVSVRQESKVRGIAASSVVADVIEDRNIRTGADRDGLDEPRVQESVSAESGLANAEATVTAGCRTGPEPAAGVRIENDLLEQTPETKAIEIGDREKLGDSHGVTSQEGGGVVRAGSVFPHRSGPPILLSKGLAYYSDCRGVRAVLQAVREQLQRAAPNLPIVSVTLGRVGLGRNFVPRLCANCGFIAWEATRPRRCLQCGAERPPTAAADHGRALFNTLERGYVTMFRQQLAALTALDTDVVFLTEHDVLYHPSHFDFTPPRRDTFYYNQNTWRVNPATGQALFYFCNQVSGLCADRQLLVEHYRRRVDYVLAHGFDRSIGFEPGGNGRSRELFGEVPVETWMSPTPNVDIKTEFCLTPGRWSQEKFRNKNTCQGWTEADEIPGWGRTKDRFAEFLAELAPDAREVA